MSRTIEAIYENGVFKPLSKIEIEEHTKLTIVLPTESEGISSKESHLDGMIDLAEECSDSDLSAHHDRYLYGETSE